MKHVQDHTNAANQRDTIAADSSTQVRSEHTTSRPVRYSRLNQLIGEARNLRGRAAVWAVVRAILKSAFAHALDYSGVTHFKYARLRRSLGGEFIRIINYHDTPASHASRLERQLKWFARNYEPVDENDLAVLVQRGEWNKSKPGLIISFDDGLLSNYDVAAPLLEKYGFVGWFFVPTDFVDAPPGDQAAFARDHQILGEASDRMAMSWDELRRLSKRHVIGAHTQSHCRMTKDLPEDRVEAEIAGSKRVIEQHLDKPVRSFCWVGGETHAYQALAAKHIRKAGYDFAFMTCSAPVTKQTNGHQLHRTHVHDYWPLAMVRMQMCGIADAANRRKRAHVNALTAANEGSNPGLQDVVSQRGRP